MKIILIILLVNITGTGTYEAKEFNSIYECKKAAEKLQAMPKNRHKKFYCVQPLEEGSKNA